MNLPNYTGPYISNGKFQSSVAFGRTKPKDQLDAASRLHDTAYATYEDRTHREMADKIYYESTRAMGGIAPIARNMVVYGNYAGRQSSNLIRNVMKWGPVGIIKYSIESTLHLNELLNDKKQRQTRQDVMNLYAQDPGWIEPPLTFNPPVGVPGKSSASPVGFGSHTRLSTVFEDPALTQYQ